jgi:hypothetical protein
LGARFVQDGHKYLCFADNVPLIFHRPLRFCHRQFGEFASASVNVGASFA